MSNNPKQAPTVVPHPQVRFSQGPYGARSPTPQASRTIGQDAYQVTTQQFMPQSQPTNQGPTLRMAPTAPQTQASTPPNTEIKIPQMSQQNMNMNFLNPAQRTQSFYNPRQAQQNQPRMQTRQPTHISFQQPLPASYVSQTPVQPIQHYFASGPQFYLNNANRQSGLVSTYLISGNQMYSSYPQNPQHYYSYGNPLPAMPRQVTPQVPSASITQPTAPIPNPNSHQPTIKNKARPKAIPIIDPKTMKPRDESEENDTHPGSGESSARQTPQPTSHNKDIQATFAKQVAQAISSDNFIENIEQSNSEIHMENVFTTQNRNEHLAQNSKLQAQTKEFIPNAAKDTPVVSALTDAVEVTVKPKDRESPIKIRKQREQSSREQKDSIKDITFKENVIEKKDESKNKESVISTPPATKEASDTTVQVKDIKEERKQQKKEKNEAKLSSAANPESSDNDNVPSSTANSVSSSMNSGSLESGKSRSQRKEAQKQGQPTAKPVSTPVPQTQPAKPNNKTNRTRDINSKGATKEGTDMDAYSDSIPSDVNSITTNSSSDNVNCNSLSSNNNDVKTESNEKSTIKTDNKFMLKSGKCVTDIVKEVPQPIKQLVVPAKVSQDEPDQADISNDIIVKAKNETNKTIAEFDCNLENRLNLTYKEGHWSPSNPEGKKVYDKHFLLALRDDPKSRTKPESLFSEVIAVEKIGDLSRYSIGGRSVDFSPSFNERNYSGKSNSRAAPAPKRNSQKGSIGGANKGSKQNIRVSISVREDVKLHETDNAWKPARLLKAETVTEEQKKTEELNKKFRGILNKLTPEKFNTLIKQVQALTIDTSERLQGVINLVFEKAVDEPNFSNAYAKLCKEISMMQVPVNAKDANEENTPECVNFRKLLVTRCQTEFEKNSAEETVVSHQKLKEIEECEDPEKKKELQLQLEEEERRIRMKSVGTIRFIGELYKQNMLTSKIMGRCLLNLLQYKDEEHLECLCKLLSTIGQQLENVKDNNFDHIFTTLKEIVDKKHGKISSRIRFMIQDVIDLRQNKWVPRRQELNPKTMDQIQKEAEHEHQTSQALNAVPLPIRKEDRSNTSSNPDKRQRKFVSDDGFTMHTSRSNRSAFSVQSDKLKSRPPQADEPLGSINQFVSWTCGSNINKMSAPPPQTSRNIYSYLGEHDVEKRQSASRPGSSRNTSYNSKGPSLERHTMKYEDGRGSRSGSQQRSSDNIQRNNNVPPTSKAAPPLVNNVNVSQNTSVDEPFEELDEKQRRLIINILEECIRECASYSECEIDVKALPPQILTAFVELAHQHVLDKSKGARLRIGELFAHLINSGTLSFESYSQGLNKILNEAGDLVIDIPKIWEYIAEIIVPLITEKIVTFTHLSKFFEPLISQNYEPKLLATIFKLVIEDKGPNYLQDLWHSSGLSLSNFMAQEQVDSFITDNNFKFLISGGNGPYIENNLSYEQIHDKLLHFFKTGEKFDNVVNWITANVGDKVKETKFIRTLATALFEDSIRDRKYSSDILKEHYKYFSKYVDSNSMFELECIYALQALMNKLEHPPGVLLSICNDLYDDSIIPQETFLTWQSSKEPAEQEGKGVALPQLKQFFFNFSQEMSDGSDDA